MSVNSSTVKRPFLYHSIQQLEEAVHAANQQLAIVSRELDFRSTRRAKKLKKLLQSSGLAETAAIKSRTR